MWPASRASLVKMASSECHGRHLTTISQSICSTHKRSTHRHGINMTSQKHLASQITNSSTGCWRVFFRWITKKTIKPPRTGPLCYEPIHKYSPVLARQLLALHSHLVMHDPLTFSTCQTHFLAWFVSEKQDIVQKCSSGVDRFDIGYFKNIVLPAERKVLEQMRQMTQGAEWRWGACCTSYFIDVDFRWLAIV